MEINQFTLDGKRLLTLHLTTKEAVALIQSLSSQIVAENSNSGRQEIGNAKLCVSHENKKSEIHKGVYFSAFVRVE